MTRQAITRQAITRRVLPALLLLAAPVAWVAVSRAQSRQEFHDPVAELNRKLDRGEATLEYRDDGWGYLSSILELLDVNTDTQALVFSKTSLQQEFISPQTPRAIYFNDQVMVGGVDGGELFEFASLDPRQGVIFYTIEQARAEKPRFERTFDLCAQCHGPVNRWAQGVLVASSIPNAEGSPAYLGVELFHVTDHTTPFEERWGGWYVTGTHGAMTHRGNAIAPDPFRPYDLDQTNSLNVTSLEGRFDVDHYLEPTSDLIALMTLEHQTAVTNLMTSIAGMYRYMGSAGANLPQRPTQEEFDETVERLATYLTFGGEAPLSDPIRGVSSFTETFPQRGPRDSQGRSLRDFDLETRLFRYPLSYMIYSPTFDALPDTVRDRVYRRVFEILSGEDKSETYAKLSPETRTAAMEILRETKPGLPDYWK